MVGFRVFDVGLLILWLVWFFRLRDDDDDQTDDGGPGGENDMALIWLAPVGQTITTVTNWCLTKFEPADMSELTDGDIEIRNSP